MALTSARCRCSWCAFTLCLPRFVLSDTVRQNQALLLTNACQLQIGFERVLIAWYRDCRRHICHYWLGEGERSYSFEFVEPVVIRDNCPQVYCATLFLFSASLFGTIIAEVNEVLLLMRSKSKGLEKILEAYLSIKPRHAALSRSQNYLAWSATGNWGKGEIMTNLNSSFDCKRVDACWCQFDVWRERILNWEFGSVWEVTASTLLNIEIMDIRLDVRTMYKVRKWERFQFLIDWEHQQVRRIWKQEFLQPKIQRNNLYAISQHKRILQRMLPDNLKLSIAQKIENNLFSKVICRLLGVPRLIYLEAALMTGTLSDCFPSWSEGDWRNKDFIFCRG